MNDNCEILWVIRPNRYLNLGNGSKKFGNRCSSTYIKYPLSYFKW